MSLSRLDEYSFFKEFHFVGWLLVGFFYVECKLGKPESVASIGSLVNFKVLNWNWTICVLAINRWFVSAPCIISAFLYQLVKILKVHIAFANVKRPSYCLVFFRPQTHLTILYYLVMLSKHLDHKFWTFIVFNLVNVLSFGLYYTTK